MNEVAKTETPGALALTEQFAGLMGREQTDVKDIILPKILLMQGLSKFVADEKALMGEFRGSLDANLLGDKATPLEVIPFHVTKTWIIFENDEYSKQVPWSPENSDWEWTGEAKVDNRVVKIRRDQSLNVYVLLPKEVTEGLYLPYVVSFRRTSYTAGKKLVTAKEKLKRFGRPLASKAFLLSAKKEENDKGSFYVWDIEQGRDTTIEEMGAVKPWFDMAQSSLLKVDETDLQEEAGRAAAPSGASDIAY